MRKAVLDANVLVSAFLNPPGAAGALVTKLHEGAFTLVLTPRLIDEVSDVLLNRARIRRAFRYADDDVEPYLTALRTGATSIAELPPIPAISRDPKDDYLIACALAAKAGFIVTRDKDLLSLIHHRSVEMISPERALELLRTP